MDNVTINISQTVDQVSINVTENIQSVSIIIDRTVVDLSPYALSSHTHGSLSLVNLSGTSASNGLTLSANVGGSGGGAALQGTGTYTQNSGTIKFETGNGITFGLTNNVMTASHNAITTAMQSNAGSNFLGTNTAVTNITATINSSGISISNPGWLTTAAQSGHTHGSNVSTASTAGTDIAFTSSSSGLTMGVPKFITTARASNDAVGLNTAVTNITATINSSGISISNPGWLTTAMASNESHIRGMAGSDTTYVSGTVYISGQNNLTVGTSVNGGSQYIRLSVGNYITTARASTDAVGLNTAVTNITATINSSGISISNPGWLTTAMASGESHIQKIGASDTSYSSGQVILSGQNNITVGTSVNGASQYIRLSVGAYITTARASNDAVGLNTAVTNITATINSSGISISNPGWLTTAAQSGHTHGSNVSTASTAGTDMAFTSASNGLTIGVPKWITTYAGGGIAASIGGNSTSAGAGYSNITSGTLILKGGNNITLSQDGANVTISGANVGGAQTGISGMGASDSTYTSGTVILSGQNNITIGTSVNGASQYIRLSVGAYITTARASNDAVGLNTAVTNITATINSSGISISNPGWLTTAMASNEPHIRAIAYSDATQTSGTVYFSGSNGISVASGANSVIISLLDSHHVDAVLPSGGGYGTGFSSITSGTFNINAVGALSMSQNGNSLSLSVPTGYLTTAAQSNQVVNSFNGSTGQISFVTGSGMSTTTNASTITFGLRSDISTAWSGQTTANQSRVVQINGLSGTMSFATGSSLSSSINGSTITWGLASNITTALQSTGAYLTTAALSSQTHIITLGGNSTSAGAGYINLSTGTIQFAGGNNITLSQNGNTVTISAGAGGGGIAASIGGNSTSGGAGYSNITSGTMHLRGGNNITLSQDGASITISGGAGGGGIALSIGGNSTSSGGGYSNITSGTAHLRGGNNITLSQDAATITIVGPTGGNVYFSNTNGITFGTSTNGVSTTVSASVNPAGGGVTEWKLYGNTAGTSSSNQTGAIYLAGGNNITLSGNSNTITISAGAGGGAVLKQYENMAFVGVTQTMTLNSRTWAVVPFILPADVTCSFLRLPVSAGVPASTTMGTTANTSMTASAANTIYAVVYTQGVVANSRSLQYLTSASVGMTNSFSFTAGAVGSNYTLSVWHTLPSVLGTTVQKSTQHAQTVTNIAISYAYSSALTGGKFIDFPFNTSLSAGNYWLAIGQSSTSNTNVAAATRLNSISQAMSHIVVSQPNLAIGAFGLATAVSSGSVLLNGGPGYWSTNVQGSTNSIDMAAVSSSASHNRPYFILYGY